MNRGVLRTAAAIIGAFPLLATPADADVPVLDRSLGRERSNDRKHSDHSKTAQSDRLEQQATTNCNLSQKEKDRRLSRSPSQAVTEDTANVAMVKHYAQKHGVPTGLALAVAHAESGISTCSGSPTGVKGVMQLTKATGRSLGYDRDVNEENIEGGIEYLGIGVKNCGETNYPCLARHYNGSTMTEQRNWSGKVARNHGWFHVYSGNGSNLPQIASPSLKTHVDYGPPAMRHANGAGVAAVDNATRGLDRSARQLQASRARIDALSASAGTTQIFQDAWDENSQTRALNAEAINELIRVQALINTLVQARSASKLTSISQATKSVRADTAINPYSCDPAVLLKMGVARNRWPACAAIADRSGNSEVHINTDTATATSALDNVEATQRAAEAAP